MENNSKILCPKCETELIGGAEYCRACGEWLDPKNQKNLPMQAMSLVVVAVIGILAFVSYTLVTAETDSEFVHPPTDAMSNMNPMDAGAMPGEFPTDYDGLVARGNMSMDHGRYSDAIESYRRALAIDNSSADVITDQGACFHALGLNDSAIVMFNKALDINPNHAIAHFNMGVVYHTIGNPDKTRKYWTRYLELNPESPIGDTLRSILNNI